MYVNNEEQWNTLSAIWTNITCIAELVVCLSVLRCIFSITTDIPQRPPKKLCDRFVEIASVGMNMKIYIFKVFSLFPNYFFLEKSLARLTNKMPCLVEIGFVLLKKILNIDNVIFLFLLGRAQNVIQWGLIDYIVFYAASAIFRPYNGGSVRKLGRGLLCVFVIW